MISQILLRLEGLQAELSMIDPVHDCEAAEKVAELAAALRSALSDERASAVDRAPQKRDAA